jgi:hypothetical protein
MADEKHVALLKQGAEIWNKWREENPYLRPDLSAADLSGANLNGANLNGANLSRADLSGAHLHETRLYESVFGNTDLSEAKGLETCEHWGPRGDA